MEHRAEEMVIGSNTENSTLSEIPVLVIKKNNPNFTFKFVFASDFSEETKKPFKKMVEFSQMFNANLF
jgi:hypothetical protein